MTFWQLPGEEDAFFRYLARNNEVVAIRHMEAIPDPAAIILVSIEEVISRTDKRRLFLSLRPVTVAPLPLHCFEPASPGEPRLYGLPVGFPAIVYDTGTVADGQLSQSNAAAYPHMAPVEVAAWMRRVFAWLRRATPQWHEYESYRVTELAARAALRGLSLVPHHGWRGPSTGRSSFDHRPRAGKD